MTDILDYRWHYAILVREDQLRPRPAREVKKRRERHWPVFRVWRPGRRTAEV